MQHPYIVNANVEDHFNQMAQNAEAQRLQKRVSPQKPGRSFLSELKERLPAVFKAQRLDESTSSPA